MKARSMPGSEAVRELGWFRAHKWLLLRRISQFGILGLFLLGPWAGVWVIKGNLSSSRILDTVPLTDPFVLLQALFARHVPETTALVGALIVVVFYGLVGGRAYCSWVCPINPVTDLAHWLRMKLGLRSNARISRRTRYGLLVVVLLLAAVTGSLVWELVNPVSMTHRAILFGMGMAWAVILMVFLLDLFVGRHLWCGHLCPMGAFYSLLGTWSLVRISAYARSRCDDCMDCFAVCPEPQVIRPALKGAEKGKGPVILDSNCTNCGRCIDVCARRVFGFRSRFNQREEVLGNVERPVAPAGVSSTAAQRRQANMEAGT